MSYNNFFHDRNNCGCNSHDDRDDIFICRDIDDNRRDRRRDDRDDGRDHRRDDHDDRKDHRRDDRDDRRDHRRDDHDRDCDHKFCTTGIGILFGISIGDRVVIRVKNSNAELSVVFQGIVDKEFALFTNGTGILRVPLRDIITVRVP